MKKPLVITVIGGIAIIAGVVFYLSNEKKNNENATEREPETKKPGERFPIPYTALNEQKSNVASTISERHSAAAQIIQNTLNEKNNEVNDGGHKVDFDEIDRRLNSLLDEE